MMTTTIMVNFTDRKSYVHFVVDAYLHPKVTSNTVYSLSVSAFKPVYFNLL